MGGKTRRYRTMVPMNDETRRVLRRLARAKGGSLSGTAGQFLDDMCPHLEQLAEAIELAASDPAGALARLGAFSDAAVDELARARQEAEREQANPPESGAPAERGGTPATERLFQIEDLSTGEKWCLGLTWSGDAADEALEKARKAAPGVEWVLREV